MFYIYIIRCKDNSLYTGITTDVKRRFSEHIKRDGKGAKYMASHDAIRIEAVWEVSTRSEALKIESRIKKLKKSQKEELIKSPLKIKDIITVEFKITSVLGEF